MEQAESETLQVTCYSRPKRVAFLVDPSTVSDAELNRIVRNCSFLRQRVSETGLAGMTGGWMVEAELEFHPSRFAHTNARPNWRLPKRPGLSGKFFEPNSGRSSRITHLDLPAVEVSPHQQVVHLEAYSEADVAARSDEVYRHVFRVYATLPSPFYGRSAA